MKNGPASGARSTSPIHIPTAPRAQLDREDLLDRRGRDRRHAEMEIEDGRYGFDEGNGRVRDRDDRGLYSDSMVASRGRKAYR